jgi:hypothetical protein
VVECVCGDSLDIWQLWFSEIFEICFKGGLVHFGTLSELRGSTLVECVGVDSLDIWKFWFSKILETCFKGGWYILEPSGSGMVECLGVYIKLVEIFDFLKSLNCYSGGVLLHFGTLSEPRWSIVVVVGTHKHQKFRIGGFLCQIRIFPGDLSIVQGFCEV